MLCQKCGKREATIHMKNNLNGKIIEYSICEDCAKEENKINVNLDFPLYAILKGYLNSGAISKEKEEEQRKCSKCGTTYEDFKKRGKFTCVNCYYEFRDDIKEILKKINRNSEYMGKVPAEYRKNKELKININKLRKEMDKAVELEDFEKAAKIRDDIKEIEGQIEKKKEV